MSIFRYTEKAYYLHGEFETPKGSGTVADRLNKLLEKTGGSVVALAPVICISQDDVSGLVAVILGDHREKPDEA